MKFKVFVTGATGYLGSAIAARLVRAGHEVFGLTRHAEQAKTLTGWGIRPVVGDLTRLDTFIGTLRNCDAAVHAAFDAEAGPAAVDQKGLEAFASAAQDGRLRRLLYTSGVWVHGETGETVVDESTPLH